MKSIILNFNEYYIPGALQIDKEGIVYPNIGKIGVDSYANEPYL